MPSSPHFPTGRSDAVRVMPSKELCAPISGAVAYTEPVRRLTGRKLLPKRQSPRSRIRDLEPEFRLALDTFRPAAVAILTCLGVAVSEFGPANGPLAAPPRRVHTPLLVWVARFARSVRRLVHGPIQRRRSSLVCSIISAGMRRVIQASSSLYVLVLISSAPAILLNHAQNYPHRHGRFLRLG